MAVVGRIYNVADTLKTDQYYFPEHNVAAYGRSFC